MTGLTFLLQARAIQTVQRPLLKRRPVQLLFVKTHELRIRNASQNLALPRITKQLGVNRLSCTVYDEA